MRILSAIFFSLLMTAALARAASVAPAAAPDKPVEARCCSTCPPDTEDPCWNTCWLSC
jgi:hypothetical protein